MKIIQTEIVNTIKLLIYKEIPILLNKVDFNDDDVFLEPLLFAYFNSKKDNIFSNEILKELMQGYFIEKDYLLINQSFNKNNIAYIPKIGYFKKGEDIPFDPIEIIDNTNIELIKHPLKLLQNIFENTSGNIINENEIIINSELINKNIVPLTHALKLIKENSPGQFKLIEQCCKKILLFKSKNKNINSFATLKAHGIAFLNVYQDDYDVAFFVDDIAHQTGHIILTTLFRDRKNFFTVDEQQNIGEILMKADNRSIYILIHAFYTYYTTFSCLDDCLKNNSFNEIQRKEAIGRIGFYLNKFDKDIDNFDKIIKYFKGIENVLAPSGIEIFLIIKDKYLEIFQKWHPATKHFNYDNQTYNFSFSNFNKLNK